MSRWRKFLACSVLAFAMGMLVAGRDGGAQSGNARQLTFPPIAHSDAHCSFSPKGDRVVFARVPHGSSFLTDLYVADVATDATSILVTGLPAGWNPNGGFEWSPDGSHIAFMADNPGGGTAIWIVDVPSGRGRP